MYDLPDRTLTMYLTNPLFDKVDLSTVPLGRMAKEISAFADRSGASDDDDDAVVVRRSARHRTGSGGLRHPEHDALSFYFLNHAFHLIRARFGAMERLPEDIAFVADLHRSTTATVGKRLLFHTFLAIVATTPNLDNSAANTALKDHLVKTFGQEVADHFRTRSFLSGSTGTTLKFGSIDTTTGAFATAVMSVYAFSSGAYWARAYTPIAALVSDCFHGKISLEQFTDQAFSAEHTGGSIFTKGMFYTHPSTDLSKILDIQDAGQIPQLIGRLLGGQGMPHFRDSHADNQDWFAGSGAGWNTRGANAGGLVPRDLARAYAIMARHFGSEIGGAIDMAAVADSAKRRGATAKAHQAKIKQAMQNVNQPAIRAGAPPKAPPATAAQQRALGATSLLLGGNLPGPK